MWSSLKFGFVALALAGSAVPVAGTSAVSDVVVVRESDVIPDDLYAAGNVVEIAGVVEGDLVAATSQRVVISGHVQGDVLVLSPRVEVSGVVDGTVRGAADEVIITGSVGHDVVVVARSLTVSGSVANDVMVAVFGMDITGSVGRDALAQAIGSVSFGGVIGRDIEVNANELIVGESTEVAGDVRYRATAQIADGATILGSQGSRGEIPVPVRVRALLLAGQLIALLVLVFAALTTFWLAPTTAAAAVKASRRFARSIVVAILALVLPPTLVGGVVAAMSAASPDLIGVAFLAMSPILVGYLAMIGVMVVVGLVPAVTALGGLAAEDRWTPQASFMVGLVVTVALSLVPVVGPYVVAVMWLVGFGGWLSGSRVARRAATV